MPPKGSRGGARGRGRGRGKAAASAAVEPAADVPMTGTDDEPASQSTLEASLPSAAEAPAPKITTPQNHLENDFASPNSSPATVPTETPAPTPARAPLQRTESTGSGSIPPAARGGRGGARGRGKNAAESRFKPKNVRRDAGELQELAQKEQARLAGIAQDRVREEARASRGRGRPPRGRGDVMGRGAGMGRGAATGVFSVAPEAMGK
jgi:DNA-directed RNA polymerase III subunit RPC4